MLVITRKIEGEIRIGPDVKVKVLGVRGGVVSIGIEAPPDVKVLRGELVERAARGWMPPE